MTTSGTHVFDTPFTDAIEEAFERAMGTDTGSPRSGYDMRSARRSINLLFSDWANRGLNMWTMDTDIVQVLTYGVGTYILDDTSTYVDVIEQVVQLPQGSSGTPGNTRYNMTRVSISTQQTRTNPDIQGRPVEVWYNRTSTGIVAHIWPLPGDGGPYSLVYTALRRMDDAGAYTNTADMPFRFLPAFISGLAFMIAEKKRQDDPNLIARLQQRYETDWLRAAEEDREKATLNIVPRGDAYRVM